MGYYESLAKPSWAPAPPVFGVVWSVLYPIIFVAYGFALYRIARGGIPSVIALPIALNLVANFAFTPIQFGLRNLLLASVDILVVLASAAWTVVALWPHLRWASLALLPYLAWVSIATVLQLSITVMNR